MALRYDITIIECFTLATRLIITITLQLEDPTLRGLPAYAMLSRTWAEDDTISSMMVLVEKWQIVRPGNVIRASEESETELVVVGVMSPNRPLPATM